MKENIKKALAYVFKDEGGYAERPEENGGAVNRGITFTTFVAWRKLQKRPLPTWSDLRAMTEAEATDIYIAQYLTGAHFNDMPNGVDYCVLDASINGGVTGAVIILQHILKQKEDGHYGLITRWAAQHRPIPWMIDAYCDARLEHYKTFQRWTVVANPSAPKEKRKTWGDIWTARIKEVKKRAHAMEPSK